jgi:hypothetical protein
MRLSGWIPDQRRRAGIATEGQELVDLPAEGVAHLGVRPVRQSQRFEATRETFRQSLGDQQRG